MVTYSFLSEYEGDGLSRNDASLSEVLGGGDVEATRSHRRAGYSGGEEGGSGLIHAHVIHYLTISGRVDNDKDEN